MQRFTASMLGHLSQDCLDEMCVAVGSFMVTLGLRDFLNIRASVPLVGELGALPWSFAQPFYELRFMILSGIWLIFHHLLFSPNRSGLLVCFRSQIGAFCKLLLLGSVVRRAPFLNFREQSCLVSCKKVMHSMSGKNCFCGHGKQS